MSASEAPAGLGFPFPTAVYDDAEALARGAVERLLRAVHESASEKPAVCLSGGSTPKRMYELLAGGDCSGAVPWHRVHWFFGDERLVDPQDKDSNRRMAREAMFGHAPVPAENIHPIRTEGLSADEAADGYAGELERFRSAERQGGAPMFDVLLLGLGSDGHTASLFPGKPGIAVRDRWVVGVPEAGLEPFVPRVSLTLPALHSARLTLFLVSGAGKRPILARIAAGEKLPAAEVSVSGHAPPLWLLDRDAAAGPRAA